MAREEQTLARFAHPGATASWPCSPLIVTRHLPAHQLQLAPTRPAGRMNQADFAWTKPWESGWPAGEGLAAAGGGTAAIAAAPPPAPPLAQPTCPRAWRHARRCEPLPAARLAPAAGAGGAAAPPWRAPRVSTWLRCRNRSGPFQRSPSPCARPGDGRSFLAVAQHARQQLHAPLLTHERMQAPSCACPSRSGSTAKAIQGPQGRAHACAVYQAAPGRLPAARAAERVRGVVRVARETTMCSECWRGLQAPAPPAPLPPPPPAFCHLAHGPLPPAPPAAWRRNPPGLSRKTWPARWRSRERAPRWRTATPSSP